MDAALAPLLDLSPSGCSDGMYLFCFTRAGVQVEVVFQGQGRGNGEHVQNALFLIL